MRCIIAEVCFLFVTVFIIIPLLVLIAPFDRKNYWTEPLLRFWGCLIFYLAGIDLIDPDRPLPGKGPYLLMANHQSNLDPPLLIWQVKLKVRFVSKIELLFLPFLGFAMWVTGYIFINRKNREKAIKSLTKAGEKIRKGTSVIIFPEGTRSRDLKQLLPFKKGGFMLAIQSGVPILPIGIAGTGGCLPKGSLKIRPGKVSYAIGKPIPTTGLTAADRDRLIDEVRNAIESLKKQAEAKIKDLPVCIESP